MNSQIILWDNDGTIMGAKNPLDESLTSSFILPGVKETMDKANFNFVISGFKSAESEAQNFDPDLVAVKFINLMNTLPIQAVAFSPTIGGVECYIVINNALGIFVKKAHEETRYNEYIGKFKKPDIGMFVVMKDVAEEEFDQTIDNNSTVMIGDTWHDKLAAQAFGIPFIHADRIHAK